MKKVIALFSAVCILCMMCVTVSADSDTCINGHSLAGGSASYYSIYQSEVSHAVHVKIVCPVCGEVSDRLFGVEKHQYSGSSPYCSVCGGTRGDRMALSTLAISRGEELINHSLYVLWPDSLFDGIDGNKVRPVELFEQLITHDYKLSGQTPWVQVCTLDHPTEPIGWIRAEVASFSGPIQDDDLTKYIGKRIMIHQAQGNARSGPGTEYPYLTSVHYGEYYTVLDAQMSSIGVVWLKLKVQYVECWVSSRMCTVYW